MCLVLFSTILCYTCIESYPKKFRSLEKDTGILIKIKECNSGLEILWKSWLAIIANQNENWLATKTFWFEKV